MNAARALVRAAKPRAQTELSHLLGRRRYAIFVQIAQGLRMRSAMWTRGSETTPRRIFVLLALAFALATPASAGQVDIPAPPGAHSFGWCVTVLPNRNIVIQDPSAGDAFAGAVHLYSSSGTLISTLSGSVSGDSVGYDPIIVLPSGNFLVPSRSWSNGGAQRAGAVTWVNGMTGLNGQFACRQLGGRRGRARDRRSCERQLHRCDGELDERRRDKRGRRHVRTCRR